ncbi:phage tail protein [Spirulina subsalsa]|uniref:phage tail protein n=1 Tax=Spirulina subsalsa TaxID=54311 RepID=UPI0002F74C46|nr:phage tail protein [Spirulina subsalsa]
MTQSLDLQLIPMQLIPATPVEETSGEAELIMTASSVKNLVVHPGEPTEMVIQLENRGTRNFRWNAQIQGNFPPEWCEIINNNALLRPGERVNAALLFQVPADFFEQEFLPRIPLRLDYDARINIYGSDIPVEEPELSRREAEERAEISQNIEPESPTEPESSEAMEAEIEPEEAGEIEEEPTPEPDLSEPIEGEIVGGELEEIPQEGETVDSLDTELFTLVQFANFQVFIRPQSLYRDFVPRIFGEIDFLGRFLKIFEQAFEPDVLTLNTLWAYLDPLLAPESLLPFLAHWVGWPLQPNLSLDQQRPLIRHAIALYRWRGTRRGLRFALHLATGLPLVESTSEDEQPIGIYESFSRGLVLGDTHLGQDATLGGGRPYHFTVRLRPPDGHELDKTLIQVVIDQEKPAFCTYDLVIES